MKKKIFILCMIFLLLICLLLGYKFLIHGNNKNIESISELDEFILSIRNYNIEAKVTVYSNKNSNTYTLKQYKMEDYQKHEIFCEDRNEGLIIENNGNKLTIKNTVLGVEEVFDNYEEVAKNAVSFEAFLDDYIAADDRNVVEENDKYIVFIKVKNLANRYIENKTLVINKKNGNVEKIEIRDVNNNETIVIEYIKFQIL